MKEINQNLQFPVSIYTGMFHPVLSQVVGYTYPKYQGTTIIYTTIKVSKSMG
jgi:hypothetical protein